MSKPPRDTPTGTRADRQLKRRFWGGYVRAYLTGGTEEIVGDATDVFGDAVLLRLQQVISAEALATPVVFTERLSNDVLAGCIGFRDNTQVIVINARFKADPEVIVHTIAEEFVHAQQRLDGVDFELQQTQFAYHERPYEIDAKRIATDIIGYEPRASQTILKREPPRDGPYDKRRL